MHDITPKPLKTERDYQDALSRLELIFGAEKGSTDGDELEILGTLIEKYEDDYY
jgi:HTH-type transcriptional regulator/antitoxin HigA